MSKLQKYLNEYVSVGMDSLSIEEMFELIDKNCKGYMKQLGETRSPLFRAAKYTGIMGKSAVRKDRKRKVGDIWYGESAYKFLNEWLESSGLARRDRSIICTPSKKQSKIFLDKGKRSIYYIFPTDPFKWSYCKNKDFNFDDNIHVILRSIDYATSQDIVDDFRKNNESMPHNELMKIVQKKVTKIMVEAADFLERYIKKDNFEKPYSNRWEIWYECRSFYYIDSGEYTL